ncbi:MAG: tetratricopeptide repeat protein [Opitutales bacterium]
MKTSPDTQSTWLGFAEKRPTGRGTVRVHLRFGRLAVAFAGLCVLAWVTAGTALFFFYKEQKGYTTIAYTDALLFPFKRAEIRRAHGEFNIEQAQAALESGDIRAAYSLALNGVRRAPHNIAGRLLLIRFFDAQGHHEGTRKLFEDGVQFAAGDEEFYRLYGQFLTQRRDDEALLTLVDQVQDDPAIDAQLKKVMALFGMQAANRLGHFEQVRRYFEGHGLINNLEAVITVSEVLARRGQREDAARYLEQFIRQFPEEPIGLAQRRLIALYLDSGEEQKAVNSALAYSLKRPLDYEPRILLVQAYHAAGRDELARREAENILRQFRHDADALTALGLYARESGDVALARRLYELALEGDIEIPRFGLFFLEAHLTAGRFAETIALCAELEAESPSWLRIYAAEFAILRGIAHLGRGEQQVGQIYLRQFLGAEGVRIPVFRAVAGTFETLGLPEYALQVLEVAHSRDSADERVLSDLLTLQIELGESRDLTARVDRLMELRRPDYAIFARIETELNSDRFIFAENREMIAEELRELTAEVQEPPLSFPMLNGEELIPTS